MEVDSLQDYLNPFAINGITRKTIPYTTIGRTTAIITNITVVFLVRV